MKKAALYARVSTERQKEEATIDSQIAEIEKKIKEDGNILFPSNRFIDDGWSGELIARPSLDSLRQAAKKQEFEILYVYDRGRLARRFAYQELIIDELTEERIEFVTLKDISATTPEEKVMQGMQGVFHEYERVKIAERFRMGKIHKTQSGKLLGYNPPFGYDYIHKTQTRNGYFKINEKEAEVVRKIFHLMGNEGLTFREIIKKLYELKITPRMGKKQTWERSSLGRLLRNETYIGNHYYNKTEAVVPQNGNGNGEKYKKTKKSSRKVRPKEDWIPIEVPAIVDKELFFKVQKQIETNKKFARRNRKYNYLLAGLIRCVCGASRIGERGGSQLYYRCRDRLRRFPLPLKCQERGINAEVIDKFVWNRVVKLLTNKGLIRRQAERWFKSKQTISYSDKTEIDNLKERLSSLDKEEERYLKAFGSGVASFDVYQNQMKELNSQRESLERQIAEKKEVLEKNKQFPNLSIKELCKRALKTIKGFNFEDKRFIVRKVIDNITADRKLAVVTGYIPINSEVNYVGLRTSSRDGWNADRYFIPFVLKIPLPSPRKARLIEERDRLGRIIKTGIC